MGRSGKNFVVEACPAFEEPCNPHDPHDSRTSRTVAMSSYTTWMRRSTYYICSSYKQSPGTQSINTCVMKMSTRLLNPWTDRQLQKKLNTNTDKPWFKDPDNGQMLSPWLLKALMTYKTPFQITCTNPEAQFPSPWLKSKLITARYHNL